MRLFLLLKVKTETWATWISDPEFSYCWGQNLKGRGNLAIFQSPCALWAIHKIIRVHSENMSAESERQPVALWDSPSDTLKMFVNPLIWLVFSEFYKIRHFHEQDSQLFMFHLDVHVDSPKTATSSYLFWTSFLLPFSWISDKLWLYLHPLKSYWSPE